MTQDELKKAVGWAALQYVQPGTIVGVGTGSTAAHFIDALGTMKGQIEELQLSSKLAVHDVLTNIYNRRYFFNSVESLLSRPVVKDFCVMLVDINQFKRINAQWGHRVGDKVLVSIVDIIQQSIRPDDILARLEGEVFGLLFTELNSAQAKIIAERMRKNVELLTGFSNRYDVPEQMTISIGTVFSTGDTRNISLVMTEADKALREAKSEGGNKVIIHHI